MRPEERSELILRNTEEIVTEEELLTLVDQKSNPSIYIGYAPTGQMHIGHYTTIRKLVDFLHADLDVTVLIADLHAHLDDEKSPYDLLEARSEYYQKAITAMIRAAGADPSAISFVRGSEFELEEPYTLDLFRLAAETTIGRTQRAGSEVVRQRDNPRLGSLLYTLMQTLDVAALQADIAYGGIDQRGIYMLSREVLPSLDYQKPICLFAPLLSGLDGEKMSASEASTSVSLTDEEAELERKIMDAYCPAGERENNGILEYLEYLMFPVLSETNEEFLISRPEQYGGDIAYRTYDSLEADFLAGELHPQDLKSATSTALNDLLAPVREELLSDPRLLATAYPESFEE